MKKYKYFVGIDVSKLTLDVVVIQSSNGIVYQYFKIENNIKAIKELLKKLPKDILICFEHTGNYGINLSYILSEKKIDFCIENPLFIKRYKGFKRGKTDKTDAKDIAEYVMTHIHKIKLYKLEDDSLLKIKLLLKQRDRIVKCIKILKQANESVENFPKSVKKDVEKSNQRQLKYLETEKSKIENQIQKTLNENLQLKEIFELAKSVIGIGDQTALYMLVKTKAFTCFESWRKFACFIGSAPFEYKSGTSVKGKTKVSYYADKKLKSLLTMAALAAKKHDPEIRQYFENKLKEGKNKMLILNNIRNKLLARVFAVVKRGTPYVNTKKFAS